MGKRDDDAFIDEDFCERVDRVIDDSLLRDNDLKPWEYDTSQEMKRDLSALRRIVENFTKADFAAVCIVAFQNYPMMYMQVMAEEIMKEGDRNGRT